MPLIKVAPGYLNTDYVVTITKPHTPSAPVVVHLAEGSMWNFHHSDVHTVERLLFSTEALQSAVEVSTRPVLFPAGYVNPKYIVTLTDGPETQYVTTLVLLDKGKWTFPDATADDVFSALVTR